VAEGSGNPHWQPKAASTDGAEWTQESWVVIFFEIALSLLEATYCTVSAGKSIQSVVATDSPVTYFDRKG